ncbi:polyamine oxidase [Geosmithia morbida]|uniref:Amine oxidase n=1 Tax=Geosmithia morbida TaxID=1094350 RepID=A0A9P4YUX7_9HYPO|nr:polyamine oxidase [Geosmithia morbida]KAF4122244.1 polyamine oxidase [Geosmithia morbida]
MRTFSMFKAAAIAAFCDGVIAGVARQQRDEGTCKKTTVAILGGGMAGISAAQALHNASISDFLILEYQDRVGGRVKSTEFGQREDANVSKVQGLGTPDGAENPVWTFAKKYDLKTVYSDYDSILTYNASGYADYSHLVDECYEAIQEMTLEAGHMLTENIQDRSARSGLAMAGWNPEHSDMEAQAAELWNWDFESAYPPDESSMIFGTANDNLTFSQFSDANNLVIDPRGYSAIIEGEAGTFLKKDDERLLLNTKINNIKYSSDGVTIFDDEGGCVTAAYAICTFSLGVLQNKDVSFEPELPKWKEESIYGFDMGTYTKVFYQFNETFWPEETQYLLYASPEKRGHWSLWQPLTPQGFMPGSNIIFATVFNDESYRLEQMSDEEAMEEGLEALRKMFPDKEIPQPTAFNYPRWTKTPWAHGSYANWPIGTTLEMHANLRANVDRLWFAGEATSAGYFGFLHGAWFEGREAGMQVSGLLKNECVEVYAGENQCGTRVHYPDLQGTTPLDHYNVDNGWPLDSLSY